MPEYRLLQPHSINKVVHPIGAIVDLPEQLGDGLTKEGKATPVTTASAPPTATQAKPRNPVQMVTQPSTRWKCCGQK